MHSSNDDRVHSATLRDGSSYEMLGCVAYREDSPPLARSSRRRATSTSARSTRAAAGCVIKENVDGRNGEDNRIIDLETGAEQVLLDENGAAGHSDIGYGYMVAEDNFNAQPGAVRVWRFDRTCAAASRPPSAARARWSISCRRGTRGLGHVAHGNSRAGVAARAADGVQQQRQSRRRLPRVNEIVCYRLDGSLNTLVVAPNLTDLNASGGGSDDYWKMPKGNLDVTGEYFIWTANAGSGRLDAFIVRVPTESLGVSPSPSPSPRRHRLSSAQRPHRHPLQRPAPSPSPAPAPVVVGSRIRCDGPMASTCRPPATRCRRRVVVVDARTRARRPSNAITSVTAACSSP